MIIKELIKREVCFAVLQYSVWLTKSKIAYSQQWEVLVPSSERPKTKGIPLLMSDVFGVKTKSKIITGEEITEFKDLLNANLFRCVVKTDDGAVYEPVNQKSIKKLIK